LGITEKKPSGRCSGIGCSHPTAPGGDGVEHLFTGFIVSRTPSGKATNGDEGVTGHCGMVNP
jgi:hypothetical protein